MPSSTTRSSSELDFCKMLDTSEPPPNAIFSRPRGYCTAKFTDIDACAVCVNKEQVEKSHVVPRLPEPRPTLHTVMTAGAVAVPTIIPLKAPSGPKHIIDSVTLIELRSDTSDTLIFYTLNGTKPDPFQRLGHSYTHAYKNPFTLPPGKVTIRALATSQNGAKQSSVVTRTFTVHKAEEGSDVDTASITSEGEQTMVVVRTHSSPEAKPSLSAQLRQRLNLSSRMNVNGPAAPPSSPPPSSSPLPRSVSAPLSHNLKSSGHTAVRPSTREKPQPVCVYCKALRPKDPTYKYCTHCGSRLPPLPHPDAKPPLQMATCPNCRAEMPPHTSTCLLCETAVLKPQPIPDILQARESSHTLKERSTCVACGTANLLNMQTCVTCEKPLPFKSPPPSPPPPPPAPPLPNPTTLRPVSGSSYAMCGMCGRVNVSDARFCDWCGSKPESSQLSVMCAGCSTSNGWHSRHCYSCGGLIKAPLRPDVELASTMKMPASVEMDKNAWVPVVEIEDVGPEMVTRETQTEGLFYPSARTIAGMRKTELLQKTIQISTMDRIPKLHAYSPGKGLWRMQVEHVLSHLKAHALGSPDFQNSMGSPQIGKLLQATVKQDESKLSLHLTFSLKGDQNQGTKNFRESVRSTSSLGEGSVTSLVATPQKKAPRRKLRKPTITTTTTSKTKLSGSTQELAAELSASGLGRRDVAEDLIQKGADVTALDGDGLPMLSLAAASGHLECIEVLVENSADVNAQTKGTGNTALHECVHKGPARIDCIEALLSHGANARLRNKDGATPCELAMRLKHDSIVTCFATYVGAGLLDKLCKPQPNLTL